MRTSVHIVTSNLVDQPALMAQERLHPYRRDASICLSPLASGDQLAHIRTEMHREYPEARISCVSNHTLLLQDIPVAAETTHDADALTWDRIYTHATVALHPAGAGDTRVVSIDVRPSPACPS
jgi:hypothetical protein